MLRLILSLGKQSILSANMLLEHFGWILGSVLF
jgi:hypothetical protein